VRRILIKDYLTPFLIVQSEFIECWATQMIFKVEISIFKHNLHLDGIM
jgi:hypothetical protein